MFNDTSGTELNSACFLQRWIQTSRGTWWRVDPAKLPVKIRGVGNSDSSNNEKALSDEELAIMRMETEEEM
jgi:hypothetical protein